MILKIVLLLLLFLFLCILLLKVDIWFLIERDNRKLYIKVLWFKTELLGKLKNAKKEPSPQKAKKKEKKNEEPAGEERNLTDFMFLIDEYLQKAKKVTKGFTKKLKITKVSIDIRYSMGDAAKTGITNGIMHAGVYALLGRIDGAFHVKEKHIVINPDFGAEKSYFEGRFETITGMRVISGMIISIRALWHFLLKDMLFHKHKKKEKAV